MHPDYREMIKEKGLLRQQNIDVKANYEIVILDKSAKHRWINLSAASTYYQGKLAGIISAIEITEQKRTEQQLRESLREIERITASVPNVIWKAEVDKQGNMSDIYISEVVDELLSLPAGTINHNWNAFLSYVKPEYIPDIEETLAGALKTPGKVIQKEYEVVKANGEEAWFLTAGKAFAGEDTVRMYGYTVDITERVRAEEALKEMNVSLEQAKQKAEEGDRLKTAFLLNISHEIRTPMNAIKGFADILVEELADPEQQREASIILSNADQLLNVIDDMLLLSRLQAEKMALIARRFSIKDFMADLISTHQYLFENKKVTLSKKLSDDLVNKMVVTDKDKLQRILSELIINAVKYTPEGSVVVGAEEEGPEKIRFYVEDSGLGIAEKDRAFIFQRFYRTEEVQRRAIRGTGLGLSIVNYLVELMGGTISVVSSPGKGSRFSLLMPVVAHSESEEDSRTSADDYDNIFSDLQVLVVEDEEDNYLLMNALLSRKVKKIEQAYDGHETLEKLKNQKYDMLLMDVKLPDMSGLKLVGVVKERYPHLKVIALTAYALPEDRINALAAGCDGYISKPVDKNVLYAKMAEVMKQG